MRLGVLGSMVWDRIEHPAGGPVERWGGICYSLAAAAAALPGGWSVRPIIKVGSDLATEASSFLESLPGLELPGGVLETPAPNNRVRLLYRDAHHRDEELTGGVPPWAWHELEPLVRGLDALYVNLISGFELGLETAVLLRTSFHGPIYADLHSLLLGTGTCGRRVPRVLERADEWLAAFDVVQVNEDELTLLAARTDPWEFAGGAVSRMVAALLVTLGPEGAAIVARTLEQRPWDMPPGAVHRLRVPSSPMATAGDPTGCGDVWGATCFVELMAGQTLAAAVRAANEAAAKNTRHRGADSLHTFLREAT